MTFRGRFAGMFLLVILILMVAPGYAGDEQDVLMVAGPQAKTCAVDGDWALCDVMKGSALELRVYKQRGGRWSRVGQGGGEVSSAVLLALGCPEDTIRNLGMGIVPRNIVESLKRKIRSGQSSHDRYTVMTCGTRYYARSFNSFEAAAPAAIWECRDERWSLVGTFTQASADALFRQNNVSPFMQRRLMTGHASDVQAGELPR